jgi:acyl-CoA dehydrogenase
LPLGSRREPADELTQRCAELVMTPSAARDRLTADLYLGKPGDGVWLLENALKKAIAAEHILRRIKDQDTDLKTAHETGLISDEEARYVNEAQEAIAKVIEVDDFDADELSGMKKEKPQREAAPRRATG